MHLFLSSLLETEVNWSTVQHPYSAILETSFSSEPKPSLSLHYSSHFPGGPGLVGTKISPFWILLELRMREMMVTNGAKWCAKLRSNCHHQQTIAHLFTGQMPFLSPNQQCQSTEGKWTQTYVWGKCKTLIQANTNLLRVAKISTLKLLLLPLVYALSRSSFSFFSMPLVNNCVL